MPILGGLLIWAMGWMLLPDLDPGPRGEWFGKRRTVITITAEGELETYRRGGGFTRPWCPLCNVVEGRVTDNTWVNQTVGIVQLVALAAVAAGGLAQLDRVTGSAPSGGWLGSRRARVEQERIDRAVARSRRVRKPRGARR